MNNNDGIKIKLFVFSIWLIGSNLLAQVKMTEEMWLLPTYKVEASEKAPIFFTGENYQGARKNDSIELSS